VQIEGLDRKGLEELARAGAMVSIPAALLLALLERIEELERKVAMLESNSRNSGKPPSSDKGNFTNPPKPKSLRARSGRKPGGQEGHKGSTLEQSAEPDHVVEHRFSPGDTCPGCSAELGAGGSGGVPGTGDCEKRQVFELPPARVEVTEHRAQRRRCPACGRKVVAAFPAGVSAPVQYGPNLRACALYLGGYQLIPYQRLAELFAELFKCPLSQGTLANFVRRGGRKARETSGHIREALKSEPVLHLDETGCRQHGKGHWLHVACTGRLTYYHLDAGRGKEAMLAMGILEGYTGKVVHDFWVAYYFFKQCGHYLCNAHLLRELVYVDEQLGQPWAGKMIDVLLAAKKLRKRENARAPGSRRVVGEQAELRISLLYSEAILEGYGLNPEPERRPGQRGRPARGKALNLLHRLEERAGEILAFLVDAEVPFDNNQAERDLRMMKVREKISGTFRSEGNARAFCDLRSVISTARKQSRRVIGTLVQLLQSPDELGKTLANPS